MPTRIDAAAAAAQKEIDNAVQQVEQQIEKNHDNRGTSSPLFRKEVQQQEMRYLDRFLHSPNRATLPSSSSCERNSSERSPLQSSCSRIASILSPYDYKDDTECDFRKDGGEDFVDERDETNNNFHAQASNLSTPPISMLKSVHSKNNNVEKAQFRTSQQKLPGENQNASIHDNQRNTPIRKCSSNSSTKIQSQHPNKSKLSCNKKSIRTPAPSINKRRQIHRKFIQRAQLSSRRILKKAVNLSRKCTRNVVQFSDFVNRSVKKALSNIHSMLDEVSNQERMDLSWKGVCGSGMTDSQINGNFSNESRQQNVSDRISLYPEERTTNPSERGSFDERKKSHVNAKRVSSTTSLTSKTGPTHPPPHAFVLTSPWIFHATKQISKQAVTMVQKSINLDGKIISCRGR